jgi:putative ABC transport system permease protein
VGSLWAAGLLLRRLRTELGMVLLLFVVVAATSFLFAAAPRLFDRAADDGLRDAALAASAAQRSLVLADDESLSPGVDGGVSGVRATGSQLAERFPATLASLISDRSLRLTTVRLSIGDPPSYDTFLSLRYQDGLTGATRLVSGRWPASRGVALPPAQWAIGSGAPGGGQDVKPVILEAAVSTAEAPELGVHVGDRLAVSLDGTDTLLARFNTGPLLARGSLHIVPTEVEVVGLFEPVDPNADYWSGDASLLQVTQIGTPLRPVAWATAYIAAETYPDLWSSGLPFRNEWHYQIDPQRLDAGQVAQLQTDLRHLNFATGASALGVSGTVVLRSGLLPILDAYTLQLARSESMLSIAAIGPLCLAGGVLGIFAILLSTRRRATLALARGRGASGSLVMGAQLWEAIIVAGGASLLGLLAAVSAVPARASPLSPVLAVTVGGAAILLLLGATWPMARRPLGLLERDDPPGRRVAPRRLVIEMTIVAIAAAAALLLRDRGLTAAEDGGVDRFNPLLGAVPVLCGLAAGIVALRVYPLPIRGLGWLADRRRDLVPVLGLRTIGRHPAAANLALLVLMLTAAFGAFSSVIVSSIDRGQVVASYLDVGADYRIVRIGLGSLAPSLDPAAIAGVEAAAAGIVDPSADFVSVPNQRASIYLEAIDPRAYAAVTSGSPAEPAWPLDFQVEPAGTGLGTDRDPIPAILSSRLPPGSADLVPGNTFRITVLGHDLTFRLVEQRAGFAGIGGPDPFAVVPFNWIRAALGSPPQPPSVLWLRAPQDAAGSLAAAVAGAGGSARVVSRYDAHAALHDAPLVAAISAGYGAAVVVSATYMALVVIGAVVLSAARRNQDLAYLRTLGITARQALALTVLEHAPPVLLALLAGAALGIGVAFLLEPGLGLATFVGTSGLPLFVDWTVLSFLAAAMIGVVVVAVTAGTWLSLRVRPVDALRIGEH